jgi:hypothetical protein
MWLGANIGDCSTGELFKFEDNCESARKINDKLHPNTEAMNEDDRLTTHTHATHCWSLSCKWTSCNALQLSRSLIHSPS